jgi:hypothetical protein
MNPNNVMRTHNLKAFEVDNLTALNPHKEKKQKRKKK